MRVDWNKNSQHAFKVQLPQTGVNLENKNIFSVPGASAYIDEELSGKKSLVVYTTPSSLPSAPKTTEGSIRSLIQRAQACDPKETNKLFTPEAGASIEEELLKQFRLTQHSIQA